MIRPSHPCAMIRILSVTLTLVVLAASAIIPVNAADHNHQQVDLDATYGQEVTLAIRGKCDYAVAYDVLTLVNTERAKVNKPPLEMDKSMMEAAMIRAAECAIYYDHNRPNGTECFTAFPTYYAAAENIAAGFTTAADAMTGWMNSAGHKANILDEMDYGFQSIGIGVFQVDNVYYWSQLFNDVPQKAKPTQKKAVTKTITIKARTKLLDLSINKKSVTLSDNKTATLTVTNRNIYFPHYDHPIHYSGLTFTTADNKVATVSDTGVVSAAGDGKTNITVKSGNGVKLFTVSASATYSSIQVTVANTTTGASIRWNKVTGAEYYKVFKRVYKNGKWSSYTTLKTTKTQSATDTLKSGDVVEYAVYPYANGEKMQSCDSGTLTHLSQPTVKLSNTSSGVKVSWKKITGATTYKVYRSVYSSGKWSSYTLHKTTKSISYTDTSVKSGQKVRYTVYACKDSCKSAVKTGVTTTYLSQPKTKVTNAANSIKISWNKVTGATTYKVYKSTYKNGKWTSYKAYKTTKSLSATDTTVKSGQKVRYTVYAYNGSNKSATKTGIATIYLTRPSVTLKPATNGVKISWKKITGATSYKVYRSVYKNGKWSAYKAYTTTKSTSYTDKSVKKGQKVRYTVYAYNSGYKSSTKTGVSIKR